MFQLLRIELYKIFKRPRTYIAFAVITVIILLVQIALKFGGEEYVDLMMTGAKDTFDIPVHQILNGYLVCFVILNLLLIHVPILVALIAGDVVAGEANMGTLRLSLTKPVGRTQYMLGKFFASSIYTVLLLLFLAVLALFGSILLFGTNDLVIFRSTSIHQMSRDDIFWRYIAAFGYAAVALTTVASLAFLLSVFAENSIGPIIATMSIVIVFTILSEMNIPLYDRTIKPYLFTTHMVAWKGFFYVRSNEEGATIKGSIENLPAILKSLSVLLIYIFLFVSSAIWIFKKKDILS